jgi:hypothetical protein
MDAMKNKSVLSHEAGSRRPPNSLRGIVNRRGNRRSPQPRDRPERRNASCRKFGVDQNVAAW